MVLNGKKIPAKGPPPSGAMGGDPTPYSERAINDLDAWFVKHIHGSAISVKTGLYNEVHAAKQRLREFLQHLDA